MGDDAMNKMVGSQVLLTSDDVHRWQTELQEAEAAKVKAEAVIEDRRKKLDAAALLSGSSFPALSIPRTPAGEQETLSAGVKRILGTFPGLVAHHELQAELRKVPHFREMLDKHKGAYYYTLIKRLADAEPPEIKKVGKRIRLTHKNEAPPEGNPEGAS
jgi:hypothetical protein